MLQKCCMDGRREDFPAGRGILALASAPTRVFAPESRPAGES